MKTCYVHIEFNQAQIEEMNRHKWIESERCHYDAGEAALFDWIQKHACSFRKHWCSSICVFKDMCKLNQSNPSHVKN